MGQIESATRTAPRQLRANSLYNLVFLIDRFLIPHEHAADSDFFTRFFLFRTGKETERYVKLILNPQGLKPLYTKLQVEFVEERCGFSVARVQFHSK